MIRLNTLLPLFISLLAINITACQESGNDTKFVVIDPSGQIAEKAKNAGFKVTGENILETDQAPKFTLGKEI